MNGSPNPYDTFTQCYTKDANTKKGQGTTCPLFLGQGQQVYYSRHCSQLWHSKWPQNISLWQSLIQCGRQPNLETTLWTFKHSTVQLQCYKVSAKIKLFSKPVSANQATPLKITKRAFVSNGDMAPETYFVSWESKTATDKKMHSTSSLSALILNGVTRCLQIEVLCRA